MCPHHGGPRSDCEDIDGDWFPQRDICYAQLAAIVANRIYDKLHEARPWHDGTETIWAEKYSRITPFHFRDAVSIWVSQHDLTPDDDFLGQAVTEQGPGETPSSSAQ